MRFSGCSHLGKGRKVLLLFMGLLACCCHFVFFLLFPFYAVTVNVIYITNVILLLSCKQYSLQLLLSLLISNDVEMATKLSDASLLIRYNKKSHIKGRAASIYSKCFFLQNKNFFKACILQYQLCAYHAYFCSCGNRCLVFTKLVLCLSPR